MCSSQFRGDHIAIELDSLFTSEQPDQRQIKRHGEYKMQRVDDVLIDLILMQIGSEEMASFRPGLAMAGMEG